MYDDAIIRLHRIDSTGRSTIGRPFTLPIQSSARSGHHIAIASLSHHLAYLPSYPPWSIACGIASPTIAYAARCHPGRPSHPLAYHRPATARPIAMACHYHQRKNHPITRVVSRSSVVILHLCVHATNVVRLRIGHTGGIPCGFLFRSQHVFRFPLLVRAFLRVLCPLAGKPRACLTPR